MTDFTKKEMVERSLLLLKTNVTIFKLKITQANVIRKELLRIEKTTCNNSHVEVLFILIQNYCFALNKNMSFASIISELESAIEDMIVMPTEFDTDKDRSIRILKKYINNIKEFSGMEFKITTEEYRKIFKKELCHELCKNVSSGSCGFKRSTF